MDSDFSKLGRAVRVLVADDDPQNRELIAEVCRGEGCEVVGVGAGDEALAHARQTSYDLLLLDAAMPGVDGLEVCRLLKCDPATALVPIVMVTASLEESVRDRATELGVAAFITKPFRIFELSHAVRAALRPHLRRQEDPPTAPYLRQRRRCADALWALPSPFSLRGRLQREIEACVRANRPVVCAVLRLENEVDLSKVAGRSATDAVLGGAVIALGEGAAAERLVRGDVDELVVLLGEQELPALAALTAQLGEHARAGAGIPLSVPISTRWGAVIAEPGAADPDQLIAWARSALEKAQEAGEPGGIERLPPRAL